MTVKQRCGLYLSNYVYKINMQTEEMRHVGIKSILLFVIDYTFPRSPRKELNTTAYLKKQ